jgi:outer membrane protein TolC
VKISLSRARMADDKINKAKLAIRSQVLMRFEEYTTYSGLLQLQNEVAENEYSRYLVAEEKFKNGEFSFEEFNRVVQSYNTAREKRLNYGMSMKRAKILLEELIGMALEDVER